MADSTVMDVSKMKVVDLRKELKSRGLSYAGDKAELVARLQSALSPEEHNDINLDSDEIDSDGVLEDEDDKSQADILDDTAVDTINEDLALSEQSAATKASADVKPQRTLKRKITTESTKDKIESKTETDGSSKKIVLNRAISFNSTTSNSGEQKEKITPPDRDSSSEKVKISAELDTKSRLELRAKRFGLPIKISDAERKEARKQRFNQNVSTLSVTSSTISTGSLSENLEKLKKRAERFGESVSKIMTDIEKKELLEKRKAKFGGVA